MEHLIDPSYDDQQAPAAQRGFACAVTILLVALPFVLFWLLA